MVSELPAVTGRHSSGSIGCRCSFASGQQEAKNTGQSQKCYNSQKPTPITCLCHLGPNSKGFPAPETAPATGNHKSPRGQFGLKPVTLNTLPYTLTAHLCVFREIHIQQCVRFPVALAKILDEIKEEGFLFLFLSGMPLGRALLWQKWHDSSDPLPPWWPTWQPRVHLMGLWGTLHFQTITLYEIDK